jgi:hypothetical protein
MVNSIWQTIEVRQMGHDPVSSLRHKEEMPMRWRPGVQNIQVRLARFGWSWSGNVSLTKVRCCVVL